MKKQLSILILFAIGLSLNAQIVKLNDVQEIKAGKLIVGLTSDEQLNDWLKSTVNKYWNFSEVSEFLPVKEATKKAKADDGLFLLSLAETEVRSLSHSSAGSGTSYRYVTTGQDIEIGTGAYKPIVRNFIPTFEGEEITEEIIIYGITTLQHMLRVMDEKNLSSNMKLKNAYKEDTPELKNRTLYLLDGWVDDKLDIEEIPEMYEGKVKVANYEAWSNAIINGEEGVAYSIVVPVPSGNGYLYVHYLVDAKTSKVLAMAYPKAAVSVSNINLSKSNTGFINKKNLNMYNDALNGKW